MKSIYVFAGTTEGRLICEFLSEEHINVTAFVATEYGAFLLDKLPFVNIVAGRLEIEEMILAIQDNSLIIDATHPYASVVTSNIIEVSKIKKSYYIRLLRKELDVAGVSVANVYEAVEYLSNNKGNALLAIGVKQLEEFTSITDFDKRFFPRVLPDECSILKCKQLGFKKSSIIAMQGPFTQSLNYELLKQYDCKYLVTKNSGSQGGILEKERAVALADAKLIIIERPTKEEGFDLENVKSYIKTFFNQRAYNYFPLFVPCIDKEILIVGGGNIATRRLLTLMQFSVKITVVAPEVSESIQQFANDNKIILHKRVFELDDIKNKFIVIATTSDIELNKQIAYACEENNIYVSDASQKEHSTFYFPSVFCFKNFISATTSQGENYKDLSIGMKAFKEKLMNGNDLNDY